MNYTNVKNPKWANQEHTLIDCEVDFDDLDDVFVTFTANPLDTGNPSSKQIFDECVAGDYGVVAEYVPYVPTQEELAAQVRAQRDALLQKLDSIVGNPLRWASFTTEQQTAWANYRQALLDVPQQAGFPNTINWATKPEGAA
jgi:hypothetical protein